jgi:MarR family transcriptional regulator, lower aerobic nicotinate degradation pathway regulator
LQAAPGNHVPDRALTDDTRTARKPGKPAAAPPTSEAAAWPLPERPGLLLRRLHQLHLALFAECVGDDRITPVQFSLLSAIAAHGDAIQSAVAADVALDRSTAASTLARMEVRGWITRRRDDADGRAMRCTLTPAGRAVLARVEPLAREAHRRTLARLAPGEAAQLMALMRAALPDGA